MQLTSLLSLLAIAAAAVEGHSTLQYINDNSAVVRRPPNNSPITSVSDSNFACNINGNVAAASKLTVAAGSSITLEWHHEGRSSQAIDPSHKGPVITYLAKVPDALTATNPSSLNWFKIYHDGYSGGTWGVDRLIANGGKYSSRIPSNIAAGDYLVRSEVIALHGAGSPGGAQFYMGCGQLTVTGGGSANPATVKFPGAYPANHAGIVISIYYPAVTSYSIPGPSVYSG